MERPSSTPLGRMVTVLVIRAGSVKVSWTGGLQPDLEHLFVDPKRCRILAHNSIHLGHAARENLLKPYLEQKKVRLGRCTYFWWRQP